MKIRIFIVTSVLFLAAACGQAKPAVNGNENTNQTPPPAAQTTTVKVAVVATGDNGKLGKKFGCEDSIVFINKTVPQTEAPLNAALKELFSLGSVSIKDSAYATELYNVIYNMQQNSNPLKFDHAVLENGVAKIYLTGDMSGLGGVCDSPRVPAQIEETAKQFSPVKSAEVYLNGQKVDWQKFGSMK